MNQPGKLFSIGAYERLLECIRDSGYGYDTFDEVEKSSKTVFMRHDIDMCLEAAAAIAEVEHRMGVRSTYFLMLRNEFYNVFSPEGLALVKRICGFNHLIGLHFKTMDGDSEEPEMLERKMAEELKILKREFGLCVRDMVSFHNPSASQMKMDFREICFVHGKYFRENIKYISDSRMQFREGSPFSLFRSGKFSRVQVLIHPVFWYYGEESLTNLAAAFLKKRGVGFSRTLLADFDGSFDK